MKRQAEKQLAKDDDDEEENDNPGEGFRMADDAVLATRVIRGLPKRSGGVRVPENAAVATPTPSAFSPAPTPSVSSFSTGTATANTTSSFSGFSFKPTTETGEKTPAASTSFFNVKPSTSSFSITPSQPSSVFSPSPNPFSSSPPTTTNTSKAFASIINNSGPANPFAPASQPASSSTDGKSSNESIPSKYYTNLRGLNTSIISAISKTVENDPFIDISDLLEQYKALRLKIQKDFDDSSSKSASTSKTTPSDNTSASAASNKPTMPAPPVAFSGFNMAQKTANTTQASNEPPKANLFEFKGTATVSAPNLFATAKDAPGSSTLFAASSSTPPTLASTTTPTVPSFFTFGASSTKTSTSSPFGTFGSSAPSAFNTGNSSSSTTTTSVFSSSSKPTSSPFGGFGSNATEKPTSSSLFGSSDKSSSSFTFGSGTAATGASETPSVVGFGSSASLFGGAKPSVESAENEKPAEENSSQEKQETASPSTTEGADPATAGLIASTNPHDEDGEGEENEETTHSSRTKAYKLTKDAEGAMKWISVGSGLLKLKKDKTSGVRRVLLRNSTNGKVIMNFGLYAGLKPTQSKASVTFMGHDAGASQTYSVRLSNENDAQELKGALEREIAFVKAKEP